MKGKVFHLQNWGSICKRHFVLKMLLEGQNYHLCDYQKNPTKVVVSHIPELWQRLRWRLGRKRTLRMNQWKKTFENLKLIKYPNWRRNWAEVHVHSQLTSPVPTQPPIGQLSTTAPPYVQLQQLQIWHSTISSQSERTCPSSIPISKPLQVQWPS